MCICRPLQAGWCIPEMKLRFGFQERRPELRQLLLHLLEHWSKTFVGAGRKTRLLKQESGSESGITWRSEWKMGQQEQHHMARRGLETSRYNMLFLGDLWPQTLQHLSVSVWRYQRPWMVQLLMFSGILHWVSLYNDWWTDRCRLAVG